MVVSLKRNSVLASSLNCTSVSFALQQAERELNDRVAERFFVKRTKRSFDLSVDSKQNWTIKLRLMSAKLDQAMKRKGFSKNPEFFLGPKIPSSPDDSEKFVTPKRYICDCCNVKLFNISAYIRHLKKHKVNVRCSGCHRIFDQTFTKRRHEVACPRNRKVKF